MFSSSPFSGGFRCLTRTRRSTNFDRILNIIYANEQWQRRYYLPYSKKREQFLTRVLNLLCILEGIAATVIHYTPFVHRHRHPVQKSLFFSLFTLSQNRCNKPPVHNPTQFTTSGNHVNPNLIFQRSNEGEVVGWGVVSTFDLRSSSPHTYSAV